MKRFLTILIALAVAVSAFSAEKNAKYITKDFDLKGFSNIYVYGIVEVQVERSNAWSVSVTMPEDFEDYLNVRVSGNKLSIGTSGIPRKLQSRFSEWKVTAKVSMPVLRGLELSGASKFNCKDSFDIGNTTFDLEISGAGKAYGIDIIGKGIDVEMSGAAMAEVSGDFEKVEMEIGGASRCDFNANAGRVDVELSGAGKAFLFGEYGDMYIEAGGASVLKLDGTAVFIGAEASGASKIEGGDSPIKRAKLDLSGASYCQLNVLEKISVEASGGASLRYSGHEGLDLDIVSISRGASVTKYR